MKEMQIECSNCGARQRFKYSTANVNSLLAFGWSSYDGVLYCPACVIKERGCPDGIGKTIEVIECAGKEDE